MNYAEMANIINCLWPKIIPEAKEALLNSVLSGKIGSVPTLDNKAYPQIASSYVVGQTPNTTGKRKEYLTAAERIAARRKFINRYIGFEKNGREYWFKIANADHHRFFLTYDSGAEGTTEFQALTTCTSMLECERILGSTAKAANPYAWKFRDTGMKYAHELKAVKLFNPYGYKFVTK